MARFQMRIETPHPILFLQDSSPDARLPDSVGPSFATATSDCLCFNVLSHVDGATLVTVSDEDCESGGARLFSGALDVPTGVLTVADSTLFRYLNVPVPAGRVAVDIWADDENNPDWVWIKLGAIRTS